MATIPRLNKETSIFDPDSPISGGIEDAGGKAERFITEVSGDGIWVTPEDAKPEGGQAVSTTTGWHISDALEFVRQGVSRFWIGLKNSGDTTPTVRIGKAYVSGATDNENHMELDYHSLQLVDKENNTYFYVSDLRGQNGSVTITDTFTGDGSTKVFYLSNFRGGAGTVKVNGSTVTSGFTVSQTTITFNTAPSDGASITIEYPCVSEFAKGYSFGIRANGNIGSMSVCEGLGCIAEGRQAHAEGNETQAKGVYSHAEGSLTVALDVMSHAEGRETTAVYLSHAEGMGTYADGISHAEGYDTVAETYSHAEGYETSATGSFSHSQNMGTTAAYDYQTAIGIYNDNQSGNLFEVGNGTSDSARSNAFAVSRTGEIATGKDVAWTTLPLASQVTAYDSTAPQYRRWGDVVQVTGEVKPTSAISIASASDTWSIGTLPSGCRPTQETRAVCHGSGTAHWLMRIGTDGSITGERYQTGGTYQSIGTSTWLPFNCTFLV